MAKPYENATPICIVLTIIAIIGIIAGLYFKTPLITILCLLPTVIYEVYRTEGESTKYASWALLVIFIIEVILIVFNVKFDLASYLGSSEQYVSGYTIPLGDVKIVGPIIMAVLSIVLMLRTRGKYTRWLAVNIIIASFALVYTLDPTIFQRYIQLATGTLLNNVNL